MSRLVTESANTATSAAILPSALVRAAVHALPRGVSRNRYRTEFLAELHGMPRDQQIRHATGVLAHVLSLRTAVTTEYLAGGADLMTTNVKVTKPLLCRLNIHHDWRIRANEDGSRYRQCARCGKYDDRIEGDFSSGAMVFGGMSGW